MSSELHHTWEVFGTSLSPTFEYMQSLCVWSAAIRDSDNTIRFRFAARYDTPDEAVHESRLTFVGGPLAALATRDFLERTSRLVTLCEDDDPDTFAVIRDFLYAKEISLAQRPLQALLGITRSAHRWQLMPLFKGLCAYLATHEKLSEADKLLSAVDIVSLPGLPKSFRHYFWDCTAMFFSDLSEQPNGVEEPGRTVDGEDRKANNEAVVQKPDMDTGSVAEEQLPIQLKLCPRFPQLWDLALAHGVVAQLIDVIQRSASHELSVDLLDLVMRYLEPRIDDENDILELMEVLGPDSMRQDYLLSGPEPAGRVCSARAIRLLAKSLIAPSRPRHGMSFSWMYNMWIITPCRMNFLYGPCIPDASGMELSSWEPRMFNASTSVHLQIETVSCPEERISVKVKWVVGACFPCQYKKMEMTLSVQEKNPCKCMYNEGKKMVIGDSCLYRMTKTVSLEKKKGEVVETVGKEIFRAFRKHHHWRAKCPVMELLQVRLVDS